MKYHKPPFLLKECKIEVTYKCTLQCIHCSSDATPENPIEMKKEKCLKIINEAHELGVEKISFSGGEPLIWNGIEESVSLASGLGIDVIVYSSGNISSQMEKMEALKAYGTKKLVFSIFGDSKSHKQITRSSNSYENTLNAITAARQAKLDVEFHFVPLAINYGSLKDVLNLAKKMGIQTVSILRFVPQGRGYLIKGYELNRLQNIELKKIIEKARTDGVNVRTGSPYNFLLLNDQPECCSAIDRVIIGPDLRLYPCDAFKQIKAEELVGTLDYSSLQNRTLKECWEKSPFLEAIRKYLTTDFEKPCADCETLEICLSGCLAQKVLKTNDLRKQPDPMCIMEKE